MKSAEGADPNQGFPHNSRAWDSYGQLRNHAMNANIPNEETQADTNVKKVSKLRIAAGVGLATIGLSIAGSLMPAVASADPYIPWSGPLHPLRHYAADVIHPGWALTHPLRALVP
jgi:hypothetical protein